MPTLTEEQIKSNLAAYEHAMRMGSTKDIQTLSSGNWMEKNGPLFIDVQYRIRPTPKLRPWKPEEVPVGAQARLKSKPAYRMLIQSAYEGGLYCGAYGCTFDHAFSNYEHSTDGGKTWLPCGVMEEGE